MMDTSHDVLKWGRGHMRWEWHWEGGGVVGLASSNVNYTGKHRNSLPVFNGAQSQTSFSIINRAVLPSVKTNAYLALPGCAFLYRSPFITSHKKGENGKKNPLQLLAEGKGGEKNQRKPWLSLFSPSVGRFFSPATSGCAVRWCIVFFSMSWRGRREPGPCLFPGLLQFITVSAAIWYPSRRPLWRRYHCLKRH